MRAAMRLGTRYAPSERTRRGGRLEYRHAYTRAVDMPSAMPIRAVLLKNYNVSGHRSASRKHSLPVHRHVYRPVILDRRPYCTGGHFAQTAILHILRMWPYCTCGHNAQTAILHVRPYCTGGHIAQGLSSNENVFRHRSTSRAHTLPVCAQVKEQWGSTKDRNQGSY